MPGQYVQAVDEALALLTSNDLATQIYTFVADVNLMRPGYEVLNLFLFFATEGASG